MVETIGDLFADLEQRCPVIQCTGSGSPCVVLGCGPDTRHASPDCNAAGTAQFAPHARTKTWNTIRLFGPSNRVADATYCCTSGYPLAGGGAFAPILCLPLGASSRAELPSMSPKSPKSSIHSGRQGGFDPTFCDNCRHYDFPESTPRFGAFGDTVPAITMPHPTSWGPDLPEHEGPHPRSGYPASNSKTSSFWAGSSVAASDPLASFFSSSQAYKVFLPIPKVRQMARITHEDVGTRQGDGLSCRD